MIAPCLQPDVVSPLFHMHWYFLPLCSLQLFWTWLTLLTTSLPLLRQSFFYNSLIVPSVMFFFAASNFKVWANARIIMRAGLISLSQSPFTNAWKANHSVAASCISGYVKRTKRRIIHILAMIRSILDSCPSNEGGLAQAFIIAFMVLFSIFDRITIKCCINVLLSPSRLLRSGLAEYNMCPDQGKSGIASSSGTFHLF